MKTILINILFLAMLNIAGFTQEVNSCYQEINNRDCNLLLETKNPLIIDVRIKKAFRKERLIGAISAPDKEKLKESLKSTDKNTPILVYCEEGSRSRTAAEIICDEFHFEKVYNLDKGIKDWKTKGYPIDSK